MTNISLLENLKIINALPNTAKTEVINKWIKRLEKTTSKYTYVNKEV